MLAIVWKACFLALNSRRFMSLFVAFTYDHHHRHEDALFLLPQWSPLKEEPLYNRESGERLKWRALTAGVGE
jgi:hypothetical protein